MTVDPNDNAANDNNNFAPFYVIHPLLNYDESYLWFKITYISWYTISYWVFGRIWIAYMSVEEAVSSPMRFWGVKKEGMLSPYAVLGH